MAPLRMRPRGRRKAFPQVSGGAAARGRVSSGQANDETGHDPATEPYHYAVIGRAIDHIAARAPEQASLDEIAASVGLSPAHFQRVFSQWVGVSPKRYQQYLALDHAKRLLAERHSVLDTAHASGLSGSGRLHDLFLRWEAMSPGEYARGGEGLEIAWGWFDTPVRAGAGDGHRPRALRPRLRRRDRPRRGDGRPARAAGRGRASSRRRSGSAAWVDGGLRRRRRDPAAPDRRAVPDQGLGGAAAGAERPCHHLLRHRRGRSATRRRCARSAPRSGATRSAGSSPATGRSGRPGGLGGYHWGLGVKRAMLAWEAARFEGAA